MAETSMLDKQRVMTRIGNDEELWLELLDIFLEDAPLKIECLNRALAERDAELLARQAHSLKGAAANIGADVFRQLACDLELAADNNDWPRCQTLRDALIRDWQALQPSLRSRC